MAEPDSFAIASGFSSSGEAPRRHVIGSSVHETHPILALSHPSLRSASVHDATDRSLSAAFWDSKSPPSLANDRYNLDGGMEQADRFKSSTGTYDDYFQLEKQRGMWSTAASPSSGPQNELASNNVSQASDAKPWVLNQLLSLVGGVAGTLVQFCSKPFRGFQAGGGQAYTLGSNGRLAKTERLQDPFADQLPQAQATASPLPGGFPDDNFGVQSIESLVEERPRMAKRLKTAENWIMVDQQGGTQSRPSTPRISERRLPASTPSQIPRPVSRASLNNPTPRRPSLIPVSRRTNAERRLSQGPSLLSSPPSTRPRSYRQSFGSPSVVSPRSGRRSSILPESERIISMMRQDELEDDARLRRMSSQMAQMLKEAQAALGSNYTLDDDYMGDGG